MKESAFQGWVVEVAQRFGWRIWHVPMPVRPIPGGKFVPDRRGRGLPDLIMLHDDPPRLVFAELKGDGKHPLSDDQREFLRLAKNIVRVWDIHRANAENAAGVVLPDDRLVGVYSWRPGQEAIVEAVLRSKVLA